jgi:hypothetical protein
MEIEFIRGPAGRAVPAQRVRRVYVAELPADGGLQPELQALEVVERARREGVAVYVSHFETCPKAGEFSGGQRGKD